MSKKRIVNNEEELIKLFLSDKKVNDIGLIFELVFENIEINYRLKLPFFESSNKILKPLLHDDINDYSFVFKNCTFNKKVKIYTLKKDLFFRNKAIFKDTLKIYDADKNIEFTKTNFLGEVRLNDGTFDGKIRFRKCNFKGDANFNNTTFNNLADFWRCKFYQKTIFYKTDFNDTAVFSGVTFKENVLFTYTLIDKLLLLRGAIAKKGFDLSLAIISGKLGLFDFNLDDFITIDIKEYVNHQLKDRGFSNEQERKETYIEIYENKYEKSVSENGDIPTKNKRETYRIIKQNHEKQNNIVASLDYKKLEKNTLLNELRLKDFSFSNKANRFILWLNKWSNDYGTSILRSLILIFIIGFIPFYLSIMETGIFDYSWSLDWTSFTTGFNYYIQFLIPTHKAGYVGKTNPTSLFYLFDFIGRIIVGYGIYQFIQAFRKYR